MSDETPQQQPRKRTTTVFLVILVFIGALAVEYQIMEMRIAAEREAAAAAEQMQVVIDRTREEHLRRLNDLRERVAELEQENESLRKTLENIGAALSGEPKTPKPGAKLTPGPALEKPTPEPAKTPKSTPEREAEEE